MKKFQKIIEKHQAQGVSADNLEYAISAVKSGTKREHIMEDLTADYRGLSNQQATAILEDLFKANGGEFRKENSNGYFYGICYLLVGIACSAYIIYVLLFGGTIYKPILVGAGAIGGLFAGIVSLVKAISGKYRDSDHHDGDSLSY